MEFVGIDVDDSGISSNYFSTLCEMPTDVCPSVSTSVMVAFQVIIFQLSVKCRRTRRCLSVGMDVGDGGISSNYFSTLCEMPTEVCPSVWTSVIVASRVIILIAKLSIAQNNNNSA
jgi:AraC-like DNA-binding protein